MSFNLSPVELCSPDAGRRVLQFVTDEGLQAHRLQVEVTETALLRDFEAARHNLALLRSEGIRIVLDDFGAGYSSISYLREISFDIVKLDGSLIAAATDPDTRISWFRGVLALCRAMNCECVAEHIESETELRLLQSLDCEYGQGFGLEPPLSRDDALRLAARKIPRTRIARR